MFKRFIKLRCLSAAAQVAAVNGLTPDHTIQLAKDLYKWVNE